MEPRETSHYAADRRIVARNMPAARPTLMQGRQGTLIPQSCGCGGGAAISGTNEERTEMNENEETDYSYIYALGNIDIRFPSLGVEKEFAQATGRGDTAGLTDQQALTSVLSQPQNRYLTRQVCWVMTIEGMETYILQPREPSDIEMLLESVRANPSRLDVDVVIGIRGPIAPATMCNGLMVPIVAFSQIYSFDRNTFINAIPRPESVAAKEEPQFRSAAGDLFDRILKMTDNAGATDEHRALNYLATRYPLIYERTTERSRADGGYSLTAVETMPSRLSGTRKLVNVSFVYTNRQTQIVDRYTVRVDVTEEFPFLSSPLTPSPYLDR